MKVLLVTGMYPTTTNPLNGAVILKQQRSLEKIGVTMEILHLRPNSGRSVIERFWELRRRLQQRDADLVHLHYGMTATLFVLLARPHCPVVATYHGSDILGYPIKRLSNLSLNTVFNIAAVLTRLLSRFIDHVIVMSEEMKARLPAVVRSRCEVIPMGVDMHLFKPSDRNLARVELGWGSEKTILFCDNNRDPVKRPDIAEETIRLVKQIHHDASLFVLRGVPHEQVPLYLNASDCLLLTSDAEGSPNIVREAFACNLPVVSVAAGDVKDLLAQHEAGELVLRQDPRTLADAVLRVLNRPRSTKLRSIIEKDSVEAVASRVYQVYEGVRNVRY